MNEPVAHSGVWILALIMIVVASWYLYKYMAPCNDLVFLDTFYATFNISFRFIAGLT